MLDSASRLKLRDETSEFTLPLAVAIFRATSVAMNMAVALYVAHLASIEVSWPLMLVGILVAVIISIGSVSLPGSISFVVSIGPIALAMGVPIEPLALLVAVEMMLSNWPGMRYCNTVQLVQDCLVRGCVAGGAFRH